MGMAIEKIDVLVADDQDIFRNRLVRMLSAEKDIRIVGSVSTGREAVDLAIAVNPEIILMDVEMEDAKAGINAAIKILSANPEMKIIFLTVHEDEGTIIEVFDTGAVDYVVKTVDCNGVLDHVRKAHKDIVQMDAAIQKVLRSEYMRLSHSMQDNLAFIRCFARFTQAEREIVSFLLQGKKTLEIAKERYVEPVTIKKQIGQILKKSGCKRTKNLCQRIRDLQVTTLFDIE